jgi:hypothetical protein
MFLIETVVTLFAFSTMLIGMPRWLRRGLVRFNWPVNVSLHVLTIWLFSGSFEGLMQAEFATILMTLCLKFILPWYDTRKDGPQPVPVISPIIREYNRHVN